MPVGQSNLDQHTYTIFLESQSAYKSFPKTHRIGAREGRIHSREFTRCNMYSCIPVFLYVVTHGCGREALTMGSTI